MKQIQSKDDYRFNITIDADSVYADFDRAVQVLRNLIENATRYVPKGKNIAIHWTEASDSGVLLKVKVLSK